MMMIRKIAGAALIAGVLSAGATGAGTAQAKPGPHIPGPPPIPGVDGPVNWNPGPPGQIKKYCPWQSPPGQWIGGPHGIPCT